MIFINFDQKLFCDKKIIHFDFNPDSEIISDCQNLSLVEINLHDGPNVKFLPSSMDKNNYERRNVARFSGGITTPYSKPKKGFSYFYCDIQLEDEFTISFWLKLNNLNIFRNSAPLAFISDEKLSDDMLFKESFQLEVSPPEDERGYLLQLNDKPNYQNFGQVDRGKWMHLTVVRKSDRVIGYLDGSWVFSQKKKSHPFKRIHFGVNRHADVGIPCDIDDIRIFKYAFNDREVAANYAISYVDQDQDPGTSLMDLLSSFENSEKYETEDSYWSYVTNLHGPIGGSFGSIAENNFAIKLDDQSGMMSKTLKKEIENVNNLKSEMQDLLSVDWFLDYEKSTQVATSYDMPVFLYFYMRENKKSEEVEQNILLSQEFKDLSSKFICYKEEYHSDSDIYEQFDVSSHPAIVIINAQRSVFNIFEYEIDKDQVFKTMEEFKETASKY